MIATEVEVSSVVSCIVIDRTHLLQVSINAGFAFTDSRRKMDGKSLKVAKRGKICCFMSHYQKTRSSGLRCKPSAAGRGRAAFSIPTKSSQHCNPGVARRG